MTLRQYFRQMMWISRSLLANVKKRKWKAIFRATWDRSYRNQLSRIRRIIGSHEYELVEIEVPLYSISLSHSINYPDWVQVITSRINDWEGLYTPPMIKVVLDWEHSKSDSERYMVVDGNHRLTAMKNCYSPGRNVKVLLMRPVA